MLTYKAESGLNFENDFYTKIEYIMSKEFNIPDLVEVQPGCNFENLLRTRTSIINYFATQRYLELLNHIPPYSPKLTEKVLFAIFSSKRDKPYKMIYRNENGEMQEKEITWNYNFLPLKIKDEVYYPRLRDISSNLYLGVIACRKQYIKDFEYKLLVSEIPEKI